MRRRPDDEDRRASILDLTEEGTTVLAHTRAYRRQRLEELLADWPGEDREEFARLLSRTNDSITAMVERDETAKAERRGPGVSARRG